MMSLDSERLLAHEETICLPLDAFDLHFYLIHGSLAIELDFFHDAVVAMNSRNSAK